jgi:hypothetical protein
MQAPLVHAQSGDHWLLVAYDVAGVLLDYFIVDGQTRPPSRGRDEVRHVGLAAGTAADVARWKQRIVASGAETWIEDHGDDEHVYFYDPRRLARSLKLPSRPLTRADSSTG